MTTITSTIVPHTSKAFTRPVISTFCTRKFEDKMRIIKPQLKYRDFLWLSEIFTPFSPSTKLTPLPWFYYRNSRSTTLPPQLGTAPQFVLYKLFCLLISCFIAPVLYYLTCSEKANKFHVRKCLVYRQSINVSTLPGPFKLSQIITFTTLKLS